MDGLTERLVTDTRAAFGAGFVPTGAPLRRSIKCALIEGTVGGAPVIAKHLLNPDPLWRWYFDREVALYRAFVREPPPVHAPRMLDADPTRGAMLLERFRGPPLCPHRRAAAPLPDVTVASLVAMRDRLVAWSRGLALAPSEPPPPAALASIRARLLEDPSAPLAWFRDGFARARELGILDGAVAADMHTALGRHPAVAFAHGDLLLRNALFIADDDPAEVALVDWECAGAHPEGWDLALVWVGVCDANRPAIEQAARRGTSAAWAAFLAAVAFGLAREIKFRGFGARPRPGRAADPTLVRLQGELARVSAELAAALRE